MRTPTRVAGIIIDKNKILLIRRKKNGKEYYVFPGGGVENKEDNKKSLLRELSSQLLSLYPSPLVKIQLYMIVTIRL
ncbi:NUDIX domain-containing protein [Patescibacteria group bacterium]